MSLDIVFRNRTLPEILYSCLLLSFFEEIFNKFYRGGHHDLVYKYLIIV